MTARRQPSTTSLSKYARSGSPDPTARSLDYCNAFWGLGDAGVDVLFARMRGAARTMDELRGFWKERALIEEDYAKRLSKLAKMTVGRDEIGEFRNSLETLRQETDKQASFHIQLAQQIRNDLETPATTFVARQTHHRKTYQSAIEKTFKTKQAHEVHVAKAREKYESDCLRINAYTAQSTLVQGKELERLALKLDRAQQTVQANERDFATFTNVLQVTTQKWEDEWKAFCDTCQDLEEERMEFTKDNVWAYANAVSIVCVSDDESCERLRLSLEQFEPEKDQENFVRDYGTGSVIPDPPKFVNYSPSEGVPLPSSSSKPTTRPAQFTRSSQRVNRLPSAQPPPQDEEPLVNTAGVGAGGGRGNAEAAPSRSQNQSRASVRHSHPNGHGPANGHAPANGTGAISSSPPSSASRAGPGQSQGQTAPMVDPTTHKTMLVVGDNAYDVDVGGSRGQPATNGTPAKVGDETDPMVKAMTNLRNAAGSSVYRSNTRKTTGEQSNAAGGSSSASPSKVLTPPPRNSYRDSAELVVGAYPIQPSSSRPSSPSPPTAGFMKPPAQQPAPVVDSVIRTYQQSFPGEVEQRRSRSNSRNDSYHQPSGQGSANQGNNLGRPVSREGHAGIGANGRSRSPSLRHPGGQDSLSISPTRGASPALNSGGSYDYRDGPGAQRAPTPNSVGIALDPNGNVAVDSMADVYQQQQQQQQLQQQRQPQQQPPPHQPPPPAPYQSHVQQLQAPPAPRQQTLQRQPSNAAYAQPPTQWQQQQIVQNPGYAPAQGYGQQQSPAHSPAYSSGHPYATAQPAQVFHAPPVGYGANGAQRAGTMHRGPTASVTSVGNDYYGQQQHQSYPSQSQSQQLGYASYRSVSPGPVNRSPSPQPMALSQPQQQPGQVVPPTRQYTEDGRGVLFYVKALYDYSATIPEEFDFQAGDIIAVTATPEDGWWSGELLDEARRIPGRHIFPSNFVHLF
ncbi:hypothetical protein BV25DRAFT_1856814 [Artomyces pyxidatus]|uniref:Uncharacterized protein n=1 Tax=Artomyces pyxidatus TaxID=48021 RepID=A0ACB8T0D5_9AGAM|nr:hypothetical protein BV25DRAFT_1856814 [Artomyces pyxidatus]